MATPFDASIRTTGINPEPVRESPVDRSGALFGQTMAAASGLIARGAYAEAQAAENFGQVASSVSKTAMNAQSGFYKAQLDKELNQKIGAWIKAKEDPVGSAAGVAIADALDNESSTIWDNLNTGKISSSDFVSTVNSFDEQSKKLREAHAQGLLQPSELVNRLMATAREHVIRNPGLADELYDHARKTLQISGVMDLRDVKQEADNAAIKRQDQMIKTLQSNLASNKIQHDLFRLYNDPSYALEKQEQLNRSYESQNSYQDVTQGYRLNELKDEDEKRNFFSSRGEFNSVTRGHEAQYATNVSSLLNSGLEEHELLLAIENLNTAARNQVDNYLSTKGVLSHPDAKAYRDSFKDYSDSTLAQITEAKTQSQRLKILENKEAMQVTLSEIEMNNKFDPATRKLINSLPPDVINKMVFSNPARGEAYLNVITGVVDSGLRNNSNTKALFTTEGSMNNPKMTDGAATMNLLLTNGQHDMLDKVIDAYHGTLKSKALSSGEHMNNLDDFYVLTSRPENLKQISELSEDSQEKMGKLNANYMQLLADSFVSYTNTGEFKNEDFKVEELPNGGIRFSSPNEDFEEALNKEYGKRFNNIVKGSAKMFGLTTNQVHDRYKAYFGGAFKVDKGKETGKPGSFQEVKLSKPLSPTLNTVLEQQAEFHGVDPNLVRAIMQIESGGRENVMGEVTSSGERAMGLMQLMPQTAKRYEVDRGDSAQNILGGIRHLKDSLNKFGNVELAVAAYFAGDPAVERAGGIPKYPKTQEYVKKVMGLLKKTKQDKFAMNTEE